MIPAYFNGCSDPQKRNELVRVAYLALNAYTQAKLYEAYGRPDDAAASGSIVAIRSGNHRAGEILQNHIVDNLSGLFGSLATIPGYDFRATWFRGKIDLILQIPEGKGFDLFKSRLGRMLMTCMSELRNQANELSTIDRRCTGAGVTYDTAAARYQAVHSTSVSPDRIELSLVTECVRLSSYQGSSNRNKTVLSTVTSDTRHYYAEEMGTQHFSDEQLRDVPFFNTVQFINTNHQDAHAPKGHEIREITLTLNFHEKDGALQNFTPENLNFGDGHCFFDGGNQSAAAQFLANFSGRYKYVGMLPKMARISKVLYNRVMREVLNAATS